MKKTYMRRNKVLLEIQSITKMPYIEERGLETDYCNELYVGSEIHLCMLRLFYVHR